MNAKQKGKLPRLQREFYRGYAVVFWTLTSSTGHRDGSTLFSRTLPRIDASCRCAFPTALSRLLPDA